MTIELQSLVPIPLKEKFTTRTSSIWNANITFDEGERVKVVAPSGTGKTTLMNIIYKVRCDYEGTVTWGNRNIRGIAGDELAQYRQQKLSVVFQDLRLFDNLTARENIELNRVLQKPFYESPKIDEFAEALGITHILNQKAGICSYGEQQRIAIIRSLMQPFEWLLMDEPFSHLDNANAQKAANLIADECTKRNAGFILTDLEEDELFDYNKRYKL